MFINFRGFRIKKQFWANLLIVLFTLLLSTNLYSQTTLKVGFFYLNGFQEYNSIGERTGYNIDYLYQIKLNTGWNFDFVDYSSFEDAIQGLSNNEIDILAPCQYTIQRSQQYDISSPIGIEFGSILALKTREDLIYEDFENFKNITFGCITNSVFEKDFLQYCKQNNFTPKIRYYSDNQDLLTALVKGEIDASVINLMTYTSNLKILGKFAPSEYHYLLKKNSKYTKELNEAIETIKYNNYAFESQLEAKWQFAYSLKPYTKEELDFIQHLQPLSILYFTDRFPLSYFDEETKQVSGIFKELFDIIAKKSGLKFNYILSTAATNNFENNKSANLISYLEYNSLPDKFKQLMITSPYFTSQKVFIHKGLSEFSKTKSSTVALAANSQAEPNMLIATYPNFKIKQYKSIEDSLLAVKNNKANLAIQNQYIVEAFLQRPVFSDLNILIQDGLTDSFCLGISSLPSPYENDTDKKRMVLSILNKTISSIDKDTISRIIISYTSGKPYRITSKDFFYKYKPTILVVLLLFLIILFFSILASEQKGRINKLIRINEKRLKNLTSNINGGIAIIDTKKNMEITYINEGFLEMLQYNSKDMDKVLYQSFKKFVQTTDAFLLDQFNNHEVKFENKISIQLRLLRRDHSTLPVLFTGTILQNAKGEKELYCVIIDNSKQIFMLEKLELEQKRYNILLEKSQDIIFDINVISEDVIVSESLQKKFGWSLPTKCCSADLSAIWHLNPDDEEKFKNAVYDVMNLIEDVSCIVRLIKTSGISLWCRIFFHAIIQNGKRVRIIGKIEDIDAEIREKELMLFKANTDSLTGLYRKETFYTLCREYLAKNTDQICALIFLDLDNFKTLNDTLGHLEGDNAICEAARKLQIIFSHYDIISRFGGDEFCVFVKDIPIDTLTFKLDWILEKLKATYTDQDKSVTITASIGVSIAPLNGTTLETLLDCADKALYTAKAKGKNCFSFFE